MNTKDGIGRRHFLLRAAVPVAGAGVFKAATQPADALAASLQSYKPSFFSAEEWAFVNAAVDRLVPAGGKGPGGVEAGIPEFIDRQMEMPYGHGATTYMQGPFQTDLPPTLGYQLPYTPRDLYRKGIASANKACRAAHGMPFHLLATERQDAFLALMEKGRISETEPPAAAVFAQLLENTHEGYFADPMYGGNRGKAHWRAIGYPGLPAFHGRDVVQFRGRAYPGAAAPKSIEDFS